MADISNITLPNGSSYNFKDSTARSSLNSKANSRTSLSLVPYGTSIPANADLNTVEYLKVGNYYCSLNVTVDTLSNCPTHDAFMMTVYSPLSTTYDNESSVQWVYRFREINTLYGRCYRQSASSNSTVGNFSYGTWFEIANTNTATTSTNGLMTAADKKKLDGIASGAQVNTVTSVAGKTGAVTISKNDVGLGNVENKSSATIRGELTKNNVTSALGYTPPTTNTTYSDFIGATSSSAGSHGLVPAPAKGDQAKFLRGDKTWQEISIPSSLPANGGIASNVSGVVAVAHGGTGATTAGAARKNLSIAPIYNDAEPTADIYNGMIWVGGGLDDNNPPYETGKVDTALSTSSTNPVQNKVITAKINSMDSTIGSLNSSVSTLNRDLTTVNNAIDNIVQPKLLYSGEFSSGTITVENLSSYTMIAIIIDNEYMVIGTQSHGVGGYVPYGGTSPSLYAYSFLYEKKLNTLTIDSGHPGVVYSGNGRSAVQKIYGIF